MSTHDNEDLEIQNLLQAAPLTHEAPPELKARLRMMAGSAKRRRPFVWVARIAVAAGVASVGIAVLLLSMAPTKAFSYEMMLRAVQQTNTFEFSLVSNESGKTHKFEIASANGRFGLKADDGALVQFDGDKMRIYDPGKNELTEIGMGGIMDPKMIASQIEKGISEGLKEMDLKKVLTDYEAKYGKENIHISPIYQKFGKSFYEVTLQKPGDEERVQMSVNAETDLPEVISIEKQRGEGNWSQDALIELRFGGAIDMDLANPQFPANAKKVEIDLGKMFQGGLNNMPNFDKEELKKSIVDGLKSLPMGGRFQSHSSGDGDNKGDGDSK